MDKTKVLSFLKALKEELNEQDIDSQASPRFWTVGDYKMVACPEGCQDSYYVNLPIGNYFGDLDTFLKDFKEDGLHEYPKKAQKEFESIQCEDTALDWLKEYYDSSASLIPVEEVHYVRQNTFFMTKREAKIHIQRNQHNYSSKAHTYAMTALRSPQVDTLWEILETFDWDSI